ncbi:MAG: triphosphoribosyl-dephospho-CoA synthase [Isosphaeraceae bacterium]
MTSSHSREGSNPITAGPLSPGRLAQLACSLEVLAPKPGNVQRHRDLPGLYLLDFIASALAIGEPLDRAGIDGVGAAVEQAVEATRRIVSTNTNLGMVLLLAPLAAVPAGADLRAGVVSVLAATTVEDSRAVYRAIRRAQPGGMGSVADQDLADEPTLPLVGVMKLAADRDLVARQYANGFREVFEDALPALLDSLASGHSVETAIVAAFLTLLSRHPDSLIARKAGVEAAAEISRRAGDLIASGWPDREGSERRLDELDAWLRDPARRLNPGTTADLVTAALYAALQDGKIQLPLQDSWKAGGRPIPV